MYFAVRLLRRRGRPLPWPDVVDPALVGDLRIEEARDGALHRYVHATRLFRNLEILHGDDRSTPFDVHIVPYRRTRSRSPGSSGWRRRNTRRAG
jgi:hypothetical protein